MNYRFPMVITALGICLLAAVGIRPAPGLAQEPSPFEISIIPQKEYAVAGHPFTYTVVITNVGAQPKSKILVKASTPPEAPFSGTTFSDPRWGTRGVEPGETGDIVWLTWETVDPSEVISFQLTVDVLPGFDEALVLHDYSVAIDNPDNIVARGAPATSKVYLNFPTVTPPPSPTPQNTVTNPTTIPGKTPTVAPVDIPETPSDQTHVSGTSKETTDRRSFIIVISLLLLIIILVSLFGLFRYRSRL